MKKIMKKMLLFLLVLSILVDILLIPRVSALDIVIDNLVSKNAYKMDGNEYRIELKIPGVDGEKKHDEVVLMVDGSYSMDNEWPAMKKTITEIGKVFLNGSGNTQLTLMAFGMGDNEVLTHIKSVSELEKSLGELPGTLLYGRSSTNCEAGFTGVEEYIENHDDTLNDVYVIYITDGNINTDETPHTFYNWRQNSWLRYKPETVALIGLEYECMHIKNGGNSSSAYKTVFGFDANPDDVMANVNSEELTKWIDLVWESVYNEANLDSKDAHPVSTAERAFVAYDDINGTYIQNVFYYALIGRSYPNKWTRTPEAGNVLASNEKVKSLYMVDYDSYSSWMDIGINGENTYFVKSDGITGLIEALDEVLIDLSQTPFNEVVVTDYMSKWVNLDKESIKIIDDTNNEVIYTAKDGWLIDENRPTNKEHPFEIELVHAKDYIDGGTNVEGNVHGDIYKITWYVKDGAMLRSDNYHLEYTVKLDEYEKGFEYGVYYPANGNTTVKYIDENSDQKEKDIKVPNVIIEHEEDKKLTGGNDTVTGYWSIECGNRNCEHYGKISSLSKKKSNKWFMYNIVTLKDGESKTFALQAGNNKNKDNIVGNYTIYRNGNNYYVTYNFNDSNIIIRDEHLSVNTKKDFTGSPGKDDNQNYGEWFNIKSNNDTIYVFAHFAIDYYK